MPAECPCGSGADYSVCCEPLHLGAATATTATELMRSRYSAYARGDGDYLLASWHPSTRPESADLDPAIEWRRLRILSQTGGGADAEEGTVTFVAHYWDPAEREYGRLEETSRFIRRDRRWFYLDELS